ncbi:DUF4229 domain-containing protein [Brachybacterium sp. YJGR34]|uniref:DUF4229 domain-containing protein n=1 Tax=Brachybacterium sp. YJGR34 TaxID=2059911 RepID=UPI000E0BABE1|nr:DUF4229 domain-containing protein [Brachybacterium sp. YJGR34]
MRSFLLYAVVRLGLWALLWWVLLLLDVGVMLAAVLAALIAMLISILFLDRLRDQVVNRWRSADQRRAERRGARADEDAAFEDTLLDAEREADPEDRDLAAAADAEVDPAALPELTAEETEEDPGGPEQEPLRGSDR